jgi:hypothetical protein
MILMSWVELTKRYLEDEGAEVQETAWGGLVAKPKDRPNFKSFIVARRLQYSFDRRVEVIGVRDIITDNLSVEQMQVALRRMLERASELELRGLIRRSAKVREWSELKNLEDMFEGLGRSGDLSELLVGNEGVFSEILKASPETLEVFPRLFPARYLESHFLTGGRDVALKGLIGQYLEHPDGLSWILRAHVIYGVPRLGESIRRNYVMVREVSERLEGLVISLLPR